MVLRKCSVEGCRLWVWCKTPTETRWVNGMALSIPTGDSEPMSDKCWYHHHGEPLPEYAR